MASVASEKAGGTNKGDTAELPVLYHLRISHYNEKVRWALDYKSVPHERRTPPPMLHMAWAYRYSRGKTFPVLVMNGIGIGDSTRIIEALEREYPDPPLYPADPAERRRALELEDHFDEELGPYIRRWLFHEALEHMEPAEFIDGAVQGAPQAVTTVMKATAPVGSRLLRLRYGINEEKAQVARHKTEAALDRVEAELQPSGYLVGDAFSVADLTAASLLFPLVRPPEAPHMVPPPLPEPLGRMREELSAHAAYRWVQEMYRRHRGTSAAVAG
jgi:glutathione S-transferase